MKKLFSLSLTLVMFFGLVPVHAQPFEEDSEVVETIDSIVSEVTYKCHDVTEADQKAMEYIHDTIKKYESKLDMIAGTEKFAKNYAKGLRKEFMERLQTAVQDNEWMDCNYEYATLDDVMDGLRKYIDDVKYVAANKDTLKNLPVHSIPDTAVLQLQQKALELYAMFEPGTMRYGQEESYDMSFMANVPFFSVDADFSILANGNQDFEANKASANVEVEGQVNVNPLGDTAESVSVNGNATFDIRIIKEKLYLGLQNLLVKSDNDNEEVQEMLKTAEILKKVLGDKFVSVAFEDAVDDGLFAMQLNYDFISKTMNGTPVIKFVHKEGNSYYGIVNPAFCDILPEDSMYECHVFNLQTLRSTDMKGFIKVDATAGENYALSISDKYMPADFSKDEDVSFMLNKPLLRWDPSGITQVDIPLDNSGNYFRYENGQLDIAFVDDYTSFKAQGPINRDNLDIAAKMTDMFSDMEANMLFSAKPSGLNQYDISAKIDVQQSGEQMFNFVLEGTSKQVPYIEVVAPTNTIDVEDFDRQMEEALQEAGL